METLAQILNSKQSLKATGFEDLTDSRNTDSISEIATEPPPEPCKFCGALRHYQKFMLGNMPPIYTPFLKPCTCPEGIAEYEQQKAEERAAKAAEEQAKKDRELQERIKWIIGESGMGERFLRRTFETFKVDDNNRKAYTAALEYVNSFDKMLPRADAPEPEKNGLFICGEPGTGKTHLVAAIANRLIQQGKPVVCATMIDLLGRIKQSFAYEGEEARVMYLYKTVPLLVIDDMGKEPPTEWAVSTIYNIINSRYEAYLPIIVTTNYDSKTLIARMTLRETKDDTTARATLDRLREMCKGLAMMGESRRGK
ncbi:MAG: ATP-binding protein [Oscillospiraceae bacterium]|nr:ATP-binding protein [Oscillospiraceae bacterium]